MYIWELKKLLRYPSVKLTPSQSASEDLQRVAKGLGEFGSLCGKAATPIIIVYHVSSTQCSLCVVVGPSAMAAIEHHFHDYL